MRTRASRKAVTILPVFLVFAAASTGTVLASDNCTVALVRALTDSVHSVDQHTEPVHTHTKATLARWEEWGQLYLAKHGHPYVPPKRKMASSDVPVPGEGRSGFKFECELPPVPTIDLALFDLLPPEELLPIPDEVPLEVAVIPPGTPLVPSGDIVPASPNYPNQPVFFGPGGVPPTTNTVPVTPIGPTPEPGSWVLLATGVMAMFGIRAIAKRGQAAETSSLS